MARRPPGPTKLAAEGLAELFEYVGRRLHGASFAEGLIPAQWSALRFLARANPSARTLSSFVRFHSATMGSAAQTLRALRRKGLIKQRVSPLDKRVRYYELTELGKKTLRADPLREFVSAIETLSARQVAELALSIQAIVRAQRSRQR
jgi:DNA-binding MarR family transcriptional regulator